MNWRDSRGAAVASRNNVPLYLASAPPPQLRKLDALIAAAQAARSQASRENLFASYEGKALVNAAFDLFECDDLYKLKQDVAHELGEDEE